MDSLFHLLNWNTVLSMVMTPLSPGVARLSSRCYCPVSVVPRGREWAAVQLWDMKGLRTPHWCSALFCVLPPVSPCRPASYKSAAAVAQPEQQLHQSTTGARSKRIWDTESIIPLRAALSGQSCISVWDKCDFCVITAVLVWGAACCANVEVLSAVVLYSKKHLLMHFLLS